MSKDRDPDQRRWLALGYGGKKAPKNVWRWWRKDAKIPSKFCIAAPNGMAVYYQDNHKLYLKDEFILEGKSQWDTTWKALAHFYGIHIRQIPPPLLEGN